MTHPQYGYSGAPYEVSCTIADPYTVNSSLGSVASACIKVQFSLDRVLNWYYGIWTP